MKMLRARSGPLAPFVAIALVLLLRAEPLFSQGMPNVRQAACDTTAQRVQNRETSLWTAVNKLIGCKAASAALLPQRWREATADTAELRALIALSAAVRDRRILAAVRATALAKDRPAVVRGAAVTVLGSYVYPTLSGRVKQNRDGTIEVMVGPRTNPYQEEGLQPLGLDEQIEIDRVLNQLTSDFKSGDVPYLARGILNTVRAACHDPKSRESVARCP